VARLHPEGAVKIPLPPLAVQQRIAAMLNEQTASAERARKAIEEELDAINKLPAALLRRPLAEDCNGTARRVRFAVW
jgi:hypothetical protein